MGERAQTSAGSAPAQAQADPGLPADLAALIESEPLRDWLVEQRWYASKTQTATSVELVEEAELAADPRLVLTLAQVRFSQGTHELYQLPLGILPAGSWDGPGAPTGAADPGRPIIGKAAGLAAYDALTDARHGRTLIDRIDAGEDLETGRGTFSFRRVEGAAPVPGDAAPRAMGVEQSNSSIVFGDAIILKVFRRLEAGINPELEVLRFLTARRFPHIASLHGWYEYEGGAVSGTLGVAQAFVPDGGDGWELALGAIPSDPDRFLDAIGALGAVTAQMHNALASDPSDPAFAAEEPSQEAMSLLTATIDEDIERIFLRLPNDERLDAIAGRGEDVRERLAARTQVGSGGRHIRIHGDFHLGQTLLTPRGWVILDFEGEPARALSERRTKRSPLRDVASMLRSFAYATSAVTLQRGASVPDDFEARLRVRFLERYLTEVDLALLPAGEAAIANMLAIFELEKAIYELRYELDNRPDWVAIPAAGIVRILESN